MAVALDDLRGHGGRFQAETGADAGLDLGIEVREHPDRP